MDIASAWEEITANESTGKTSKTERGTFGLDPKNDHLVMCFLLGVDQKTSDGQAQAYFQYVQGGTLQPGNHHIVKGSGISSVIASLEVRGTSARAVCVAIDTTVSGGPAGPKGATGATGAEGPAGPAGPTGPTGPK